MLSKRRLWIVFIVFLLVMLLAACRRDANADKTLYVAPTTIPCEGNGPQLCYLVSEDLNAEWTLLYDGIVNFAYEPGFFYQLLVTETAVDDPPADASSIQLTLKEVVLVEAATIKTVLIAPERMPCETTESGECYAYKEGGLGEWLPYSGEIQGLNYETGYYYQLTVAERQSASQAEPIWTRLQVSKSSEAPALPVAESPTATAVPDVVEDVPADASAAAYKRVAILNLGVQTVVPDAWSPIGENGQAWSGGPDVFVNFTAAPGVSARAALEQMTLSVQAANPEAAGQLFDASVNGRSWSVYTSSDGQTSIATAATLEGSNVYMVSLFADPLQQDAILQAILENFVIVGAPVTP
ncbi:MAG: DUF4377 domain-containing protein [Chloroflexota bacterium]